MTSSHYLRKLGLAGDFLRDGIRLLTELVMEAGGRGADRCWAVRADGRPPDVTQRRAHTALRDAALLDYD